MTAPLVKVHETVNDYMNSAENRSLATEIGSKVLTLFRSVLCKKHTFISERTFKFHLAQRMRMLARSVGYWHWTMWENEAINISFRPWITCDQELFGGKGEKKTPKQKGRRTTWSKDRPRTISLLWTFPSEVHCIWLLQCCGFKSCQCWFANQEYMSCHWKTH